MKKDQVDLTAYVRYEPASPSGLVWAIDRWCGANYQILVCMRGKPAGSVGSRGYWTVKINGTTYLVHRIVCNLNGLDTPCEMDVDHLDGDKLNNNIRNLRVISHKTNGHNQGKSVNNLSGKVGVFWHWDSKSSNLYAAALHNDLTGKQKIKYFPVKKLGLLPAFRDACIYRDNMLDLLNSLGANYTKRHGR